MHFRLQHTFDKLESQRRKLLLEVKMMPDETFNTAPENRWSVNQVLAHLVAAERLSLMYMQKKVLGAKELSDTGLWEELKMLILKISQRLPGLKFKAPTVVKEHTSAYSSYDALAADWDKVRAEWKQFLSNLPDEFVRRKIYRHVVAGRLNAHHSLVFAGEHIAHHIPQIRALQKRTKSSRIA
jgi:uncharacterized damage-inducible protein DinB